MSWAHTQARLCPGSPSAAQFTARTGEVFFTLSQQSVRVRNFNVPQSLGYDREAEKNIPRKVTPAVVISPTGPFNSAVTTELLVAYCLNLSEMVELKLVSDDHFPRFEDCARSPPPPPHATPTPEQHLRESTPSRRSPARGAQESDDGVLSLHVWRESGARYHRGFDQADADLEE